MSPAPDWLLALQRTVGGEVHADPVTLALYSTDASPYQIEPLAVVVPRSDDDVRAVLRVANEFGVPVLPRGGATSLAGQTVGRAIQLDFSKYLNRILEIDRHARSARVQPGLVLDHLNGALAPLGLRFAPDVSPADRATIGGMIGNNACGAYSLRYGKTADHVLELRVLLSDGTETLLRPLDAAELAARRAQRDLEGACYRVVGDLAARHAGEIERRFPKLLRRVGGYNLDAFVGGDRFNLCDLVVGSEGTLALVLEAKLRLVPRPAATGVALLEFAQLHDALDAVVACLECRPAAVELIDRLLIDLTRRSLEYKHYLDVLRTDAGALLMVEFWGDSQAEVRGDIERLLAHPGLGSVRAATPAITPEEQAPVWLVRKAGLPLLQSMSPGLKPETVIEDAAVPPERLSDYVRRLEAILERHGKVASFYGHASVGLLHVRPLLDYHLPGDIATMRALSEETRDLVLEFGGAISGEHGDGLLRSEHNRIVFGSELYEAFRELKYTWDERGILNPGKIVDAPPLDRHLRYVPPRGEPLQLTAHYAFRDTGGMLGAAELCNGNGACRKTVGGTMCPSYMVTRDEEHSTRGRANALRLALGGALSEAELWSERMHAVLDLCVECKGCTAECPSRVNMTRLKSEWLAQYYARRGTPARALLFGNIRTIARIGSALAPLSNRLLRAPGAAFLSYKLLGISPQRRLPRFASPTFLQWLEKRNAKPQTQRRKDERNAKTQRRKGQLTINQASPASPTSPFLNSQFSILNSVVLFPDTFTNYNEPHIGIAATQLLERLGYRVLVPQRSLCCGRPMLSKGLLRQAKRLARAQLDWLAPYAGHGVPIVGLEPSCVLSFRDEYPDLLDDPRATALAGRALLLDEFLAAELERGAFDPALLGSRDGRPALLHGHCHQKALSSSAHSLRLLSAAGYAAREVDSGCCGMAGSFGYEAEHADISLKMAERALLPAVRAQPSDGVIVASGTSCRAQIAQATGRRVLHIAEALQLNGATETQRRKDAKN